MKKIAAAACLLAMPLLTGCNSQEGPRPDGPSPSSSSSSSTSTGQTGASQFMKFGQSYTWDDKVQITVKDPSGFTPSKYSSTKSSFSSFSSLTVTVKNGTDQILDPSRIRYTATSGDKETDMVDDSDNEVGRGGRAQILPGKSLTFKIGYGHTPGEDFNLIVGRYTADYKKMSDAIYSDKIA